MIESSKEISYVAYFDDGAAVTKDESVASETFDLTTVEGIEDFDEVEVKAGTTVATFDIACGPEDGTAGGTGEQEGDTDDTGDTGETGEGAVITLSGCTVESTKDISYIEFFTGDSSWKDESMNSETFDLTTVEGIEDVESIEVKSSTTVERFSVACGPEDGTAGGTGEQEGDTDTGDTGETGEGAVITLSGCTVESTKDISYIEFFTGDSSWKDESMNSETFDLTTVEGIEDVESIEVKSSTTVERFSISCGDTDGSTAGASGSTEEDERDDSGTAETQETSDTEATEADESAAAGEDTDHTRTEDSADDTEETRETEDTEETAEAEETEAQEESEEDTEDSDDSDEDIEDSEDSDEDEDEDEEDDAGDDS